MITRRKIILALGASALAPLASFAQHAAKIQRIGFLGASTAASFAPRVEELRKALAEFGYVEGRNVVYEYRWTGNDNERLPELAAELVRAKCDVIVTSGTPAILALKRATTTIPIVMATSGDAAKYGLVASLSRPGGNVTGLSFFAPELYGKRVEMIKEAVPGTKVIGYLTNPDNPTLQESGPAVEKSAKRLKMTSRPFAARNAKEFEIAFAAMAKQRVDAVLVTNDNVITANYPLIAALAAKQRLPSVGPSEFAAAGGLIGFGPLNLDLFRRSAAYVDKILKGAKPADLPVEQPSIYEVVINVKTAKALGIKFSNSILVQATKVIE